MKLEQAARQLVTNWDSGLTIHNELDAMREALAELDIEEMTQDEYEVGSLENAEKFAIIRMAREANVPFETETDGSLYGMIGRMCNEDFFKFAALVAAHEREACAKVCDVEIVGDEYATALINSYADTIRARSENGTA